MYAISRELAAQLEAHDWPGNIRELENFIRRGLALASGTTLGPQVLESGTTAQQDKSAAFTAGLTLQEMERQLLKKTLEATGGNRTRAAELMGVSLRTVRNKIREYGLPARRAS
jgi:DNA-binding NtrC family response regulator